jgi:subtilisin family serine protease
MQIHSEYENQERMLTMKNGIVLFTILTLLSGTHSPALSKSIVKTDISPDYSAANLYFHNNSPGITSENATPGSKKTLIVELKEKPLLDIYNSMGDVDMQDDAGKEDTSFSDFKNTAQADHLEHRAMDLQNKTIQKISKELKKGNEVGIKDQFTDVINAFVMKGDAADIERIKGLPHVKNVYISNNYERILPAQDSTPHMETGTGNYLMHADHLPFQGEGMTIAILDTGIDTKHKAFSKKPDNQKYSKSRIEKILANNELAAETLNGSALSPDDVYVNDKIPFAYDYSDKDADVNPTEESIALGNDHGTHVAGIAAANSPAMAGIAPQAQLVIMKVFSDHHTLTDDTTCLAAFEDCMALDVDVINMSFGKACGYSNDETDLLNGVLNRIQKAGINLAVSAGNNGSSAMFNAYNAPLSSNPDTSTIGSPASFTAPIAVACANNKVTYEPCFMLHDGTKIAYDDYTNALYGVNKSFAGLVASGSALEYCSLSDSNTNQNIQGKVVVVDTIPDTYDEIIENAASHGAVGLIIINAAPLRSTKLKTYYFPIVCISAANCAKLLNQDSFAFTIPYTFMPHDSPGAMYQLSSWGATPDLLLKPEITAIGGSVYAPLPKNRYGNKAGTSMACPQIAGISAIVKQYIQKDPKYAALTKTDMESLVSNLLMSTAIPIMTSCRSVSGAAVTTAYSPRRQGAGLVNAQAALDTKAVIYTAEGTKRPVLNFGDDVEEAGIYTKSFHVKNYSEKPLTYVADSSVMTESWHSNGKNTFISEVPTLLENKAHFTLSNRTVTTASPSAIILAPHEDIEISVRITLTKNDKEYIKEHFCNGSFVEGFFRLISLNEDGVDLGLPFVGFFGDWTKAPILDSATTYDNPKKEGYEPASNISYMALQSLPYYHRYLSHLRSYLGKENNFLILGQNRYNPVPVFDPGKIAFSPNNDGILDEFWWSYVPLRGPKHTEYTITDSSGRTLYQLSSSVDRKSICSTSTYLFTNNLTKIRWNGKNQNGTALPNNAVVTFQFKASLDYTVHGQNNRKDTILLPITIDTQAPDLVEAVFDKDHTIHAVVKDNQYVAAIVVYDFNHSSANTVISGILLNETEKNVTSSVSLPCGNETGKQYLISVADYAGNTSNYIISADTATVDSPVLHSSWQRKGAAVCGLAD